MRYIAYVKPPSEKGNRYAITILEGPALEAGWGDPEFEDWIKHREEQLADLDATLRILDPWFRADTIAPKRIRR